MGRVNTEPEVVIGCLSAKYSVFPMPSLRFRTSNDAVCFIGSKYTRDDRGRDDRRRSPVQLTRYEKRKRRRGSPLPAFLTVHAKDFGTSSRSELESNAGVDAKVRKTAELSKRAEAPSGDHRNDGDRRVRITYTFMTVINL